METVIQFVLGMNVDTYIDLLVPNDACALSQGAGFNS